jgi:hypothetical protein
MRVKFFLSFITLAICGSAGFAGSIVKIFEFSNPSIERTGIYSVINFESARLLGEPGKATLPFFPVKLLLPPGEVAISIELRFEKPYTLQGEFYLLPRQDIQPLSKEDDGKWLMDEDFYRSSTAYPSSFTPQIETHFYNGCGIALSAFTPVRYIPSEKKVIYFQRVKVTIRTAPDPGSEAHQRNFFPSEKKAEDLAGLIQNPDRISQYFSGRSYRTNDYDYLIITQNQYVSEFDTLADFYKPRGIRTRIKSTEYIAANTTGADLQEKIRNYIIGEYQASGIDYVLIGGDVEVVPYRGFYCHVHSDIIYTDNGIPADLYYSALDGNWNTDGDNLWGEPGEDDLYPEVGIGRMTFKDTTELHNMLHKTILYQASPVVGELTKPLLAGEFLYNPPITYGSDYLRLLVGYRTNNGYSTHGIPSSQPRDTLYDSPTYGWDKYTLMSHINSGHPWIHHVGHANYSYALRLDYGDITNANFSQVNGINHNYTIIYTHGCMCGGFDDPWCIAEKMIGIDNFAVAFIGNSRYGWFNQGTTDGPSEHLHREFMDAMYHDSLYHIGMAHLKSKSETAPFVDIDTLEGGGGEFEPGATRWCFYDNNLLGDPMMAVWTEEPYQVEAGYPALIPIGASSVAVQINGPQGMCRNFKCSIYRNDTLFGVANTNSSGAAVISLQNGLTKGPVFLVVSGYNILPQYFEIHVSDYWLGLNNDWSDNVNWYTGAVPDTSSYVIIPAAPSGGKFPLKNRFNGRQCKEIYIEPGAQIYIRGGETFSVGGD